MNAWDTTLVVATVAVCIAAACVCVRWDRPTGEKDEQPEISSVRVRTINVPPGDAVCHALLPYDAPLVSMWGKQGMTVQKWTVYSAKDVAKEVLSTQEYLCLRRLDAAEARCVYRACIAVACGGWAMTGPPPPSFRMHLRSIDERISVVKESACRHPVGIPPAWGIAISGRLVWYAPPGHRWPRDMIRGVMNGLGALSAPPGVAGVPGFDKDDDADFDSAVAYNAMWLADGSLRSRVVLATLKTQVQANTPEPSRPSV